MSSATLKTSSSIRLHEMRRFQVYRLERPRNRSLFRRLSLGLRARLGR
jgi:hypothetical protein